MIFIINFLSIIIYGLIYNEAKNRYGKSKVVLRSFLGVIAFQMIFLIGFRDVSIGNDTQHYLTRFNIYKTKELTQIFSDNFQEYGYSLLIKITAAIYDNFDFFKIIVAVITIVPIVITILKCSKNPFLSLLIFIAFDYYAFMFSGMRQGIAYALCILSFLCIQNKKPIKFVLVVLLAAQFHKSAYIFLPAYWIANIKMNRYTLVGLGLIFIVVVIFKNKFYDLVENGLYRTVDHAYEAKNTGAFMLLVRQFAIAGVMLFFAGKNSLSSINYTRFTMLVCAGAILSVFATIGGNAQRAANYYCMFLIFGIPELLDSLDDSMVKRVVNVTVIVGILAMFIYSLACDAYEIMPYRLFIE